MSELPTPTGEIEPGGKKLAIGLALGFTVAPGLICAIMSNPDIPAPVKAMSAAAFSAIAGTFVIEGAVQNMRAKRDRTPSRE